MRTAIELDSLDWLAKGSFAVALVAWLVTASGLAHQGLNVAFGRRLTPAMARDDPPAA